MKKQMRILLTLGLLVSGCASGPSYDVSTVQQNLSNALQRNDEVTQKAQNDFNEKKTLVENLKGDADLRARIARMQTHLDVMLAERKKMSTANSELASASYGRRNVPDDREDYGRLNSLFKQFQSSVNASNQAFAEYSRESNALTDTISERKLLFSIEPVDFYKRVQQSISVAQDNALTMQTELNRAKQLMEHGTTSPAQQTSRQKIYAEMESQGKQYTAKAQRLAQYTRDMRTVTGDTRITSLEPEWPKAQKIIADFDRSVQELGQINVKFQKSLGEFRQWGSSKQVP